MWINIGVFAVVGTIGLTLALSLTHAVEKYFPQSTPEPEIIYINAFEEQYNECSVLLDEALIGLENAVIMLEEKKKQEKTGG